MGNQETHLILNPVAADRAADFERFIAEVVEPAARAQQPELVDRYRVLKATSAEPADDGVVTFVFLLEGGSLNDDWDLDRLLAAHYGREEAERLMGAWSGMFVPFRRWLDALGEPVSEGTQIGWTFAPLNGADVSG